MICGSMFAGKSEELIRLARRALYAKKIVQVFKPKIDDRYDQTMVVTHEGVSHTAIAVSGLDDLQSKINPIAEMIFIEEAQFFDSNLTHFVEELSQRSHDVILAGLDQDFRCQPFGPMPELLAIADSVTKLRAICMKCGATASHTYRMINGKPAHWNDPVIMIGATEKYESRCKKCYRIRGKPQTK